MLNFIERLARDIAKAAKMKMPELEEALENAENRTISQLTALSLAKKAAEGGMDAIKMIREMARWVQEKKELDGEERAVPMVELRVVMPDKEREED